MKIIAFGFFKTSLTGKSRKSYIQDPWNRLDFFLVIVQLIYQFKNSFSEKSNTVKIILKGMKTLRALRPLRMISRFKGLRVGLNTLVNSAQQIINVVMLSLIVFIIFSVFGMHMFKGTFYHCVIDGDK
jgi:voltage-dependent calcium channel L type alpha-1D